MTVGNLVRRTLPLDLVDVVGLRVELHDPRRLVDVVVVAVTAASGAVPFPGIRLVRRNSGLEVEGQVPFLHPLVGGDQQRGRPRLRRRWRR